MAPVNCVCSFRLLEKSLVCDRDTIIFFHYGLRCALVGRALTCALPCSFVLPPPFPLVLLLLVRMAMLFLGKSSLFFRSNLVLRLSQLYFTCATLAWPFDFVISHC